MCHYAHRWVFVGRSMISIDSFLVFFATGYALYSVSLFLAFRFFSVCVCVVLRPIFSSYVFPCIKYVRDTERVLFKVIRANLFSSEATIYMRSQYSWKINANNQMRIDIHIPIWMCYVFTVCSRLRFVVEYNYTYRE